ncbi:hypothetical protein VC273_16800 [Xanthomonas nasturtii]|uniref:hypothetical protein n=1 Tax=Xanthomonas TaxID=338 RepID=UPI002B22F81D|nr:MULTISPECIES: hypothetical protein [Xanthomonas]MEA9557499.1 hypothetical protein [Xanthomonas nasturtii]MEA9588555.1 hypothetical protein [Xanthomonas sp. WHRI 10064B]MEA9613540.1 hypothetical protein [Xanthomonas sp. WHRI 10064A]
MARDIAKVAAALAALLMLGACSSKADKARSEFIGSCASSGGSESVCECAFDKLQAHYGEEGIVAIQSEGSPPPDFIDQLADAAQQCRKR